MTVAAHSSLLCPNPLSEFVNFRRLAVRETGGRYRFMTLRPVSCRTTKSLPDGIAKLSFQTQARDGVWEEWLSVENKRATIARNYAWNGNTPKRGIAMPRFDLWLGTPDWESTLDASLWHDAMFQYSALPEMPWNLAEANLAYLLLARRRKSHVARPIYCALNEFSAPFWGRPHSENRCVVTPDLLP